MVKSLLRWSWALAVPVSLHAQPFTHADTLRGSIGPGRAWWNVTYYDVSVRPDFATKSIQGSTMIAFRALEAGQRMQIDLQQPMVLDSVMADVTVYRPQGFVIEEHRIEAVHEGNVIWVDLPTAMKAGEANTITLHYHGAPVEARNAPWDGGWIWTKDEQGSPWMTVACQVLGASVWYPCKDHQSDEPDDGAALHITVPDGLTGVGNGRAKGVTKNADGTSTWHWKVTEPINTYNLVPYIGKYALHSSDTMQGAQGELTLDYWLLERPSPPGKEVERALREVAELAHLHTNVVPMLRCFEDWFGPYPFYADGYKLVESPHLGMEHQSAIAYGNGFQNGYRGMDLSGTGHGSQWDFIIVHESGHEWFGNSITSTDIADMWVHEGFTNYSEAIYTGCQQGEAAGNAYLIGSRRNIRNDKPIVGPYGVNQEGSNDMYFKAASMIHLIRQAVGDSVFKAMLREMNVRWYHNVVTGQEAEAFISTFTGHDFRPVFDQYLRTTKVPELEWGRYKGHLWMRWTNCVDGFAMRIATLPSTGGERRWFDVSDHWTSHPVKEELSLDPNWYATVRTASKATLKQAWRDLRK